MLANTLPPALAEGDLVVIISPSSALADGSIVDGAKRTLEGWGLRVRVAPHALDHVGHFAGSDADRLADLMDALHDPEVKCILCSRGGYGVIRLLEAADLSCLKENPKWMVGFSDITALHAAFANVGCCSMHGPMAKALSHSHSQKRVLHTMRDILFGTKTMNYKVDAHPMNRAGVAKGRLFGGNLSLLYALQGSPYQFPMEGSILLIEDVSERLYHIDRMMHNLRLSGALAKISGLVVGQFADVVPNAEFGQTLEEIIMSMVADYDYPVCFNFPVGHVNHNVPIVEGAMVRLSVTDKGASLVQK